MPPPPEPPEEPLAVSVRVSDVRAAGWAPHLHRDLGRQPRPGAVVRPGLGGDGGGWIALGYSPLTLRPDGLTPVADAWFAGQAVPGAGTTDPHVRVRCDQRPGSLCGKEMELSPRPSRRDASKVPASGRSESAFSTNGGRTPGGKSRSSRCCGLKSPKRARSPMRSSTQCWMVRFRRLSRRRGDVARDGRAAQCVTAGAASAPTRM